jgi:hypothetical protein
MPSGPSAAPTSRAGSNRALLKRKGKFFQALVDYIENRPEWRDAVCLNHFTGTVGSPNRLSIGPSPSWAADTIALTCSNWPTSARTNIARRPGGAHLIGDTLSRTLVIEPIDRHVGAPCRKLARHGDTDPLLRPGDHNHLARKLQFQIPLTRFRPRLAGRSRRPHPSAA